MSQAFGDERLEAQLRAILDERAEEVASRARTGTEVATELQHRLRGSARPAASGDRVVRILAVAAVLAALLALLAFGVGRSRPPVRLQIAVDLPLGVEPGADTIADSVRQAIGAASARDRPYVLALPPAMVFDDTVAGAPDRDAGAANVRAAIADPHTVALIGPYNSSVAEAEIPVANAAGLLQCSESNTAPGLTIGSAAAALRPRPDRPTYVRVAATDDAEAAGAARFLVERLGAHSVYFVSKPGWAGGRIAQVIDAVRRLGARTAGIASLAGPPETDAAKAAMVVQAAPDVVFYDGPGDLGAHLATTIAGAGGDLPMVSLDTILDGPRSSAGSFLNLAGRAATNVYAVFPAGFDPIRGLDVAAAHIETFGVRPTRYAFGAYACTEIVQAALDGLELPESADLAAWREALRAAVTQRGATYQTVLGAVSFDASGDVAPTRVSVYRADPAVNDWAFSEVVELPPGG
ncbi:MAG TPA: branched-chain amino acid ABC transporter substrate-binding protein [Candidatus Limnocylindrales bacterium]